MTDTVAPKERSKIMANVKSRGNKSTELKAIKFFKEYGIKGWRRKYPLIGNPDFVIPKSRLAIFIDGCFWHGCKEHCRIPESNCEYWVYKTDKNIKRDKLINPELKKRQWTVIRIWEHELRKGNHKEKLGKIREIVESGKGEYLSPSPHTTLASGSRTGRLMKTTSNYSGSEKRPISL